MRAIASPPGPVFAFEDLGEDLARPPLAAVRFFRRMGVRLSLKIWAPLPVEVRWSFVKEGARDQIDEHVARTLLRAVPIRLIELVDEHHTLEREPAVGLAEALGMDGSWTREAWYELSPFHRFVLNALCHNKRLLWRAFGEIAAPERRARVRSWSGLLAHAEVQIRAEGRVRDDLVRLLAKELLLEGRALLLAQASGRRAARRAHELFDLHADKTTGAVELDWSVRMPAASVLWQAHVSTHEGEFFPAASLIAATTSAVCLADMLKEFDPRVKVRQARLIEEGWQVGKFEIEAATRVFSG